MNWTCVVALVALVGMVGCGGGSALVEVPEPQVTGVEPASGGVGGGLDIIIKGQNLANDGPGVNDVLIGGVPATNVVVRDASTIVCRTPPNTEGAADVTVKKNNGTGVLAGGFMYYPPPTLLSIEPNEGPRNGGTPVVIMGSGFLNNQPGETIPSIDLKAFVDIVVVSDTEINAVSPVSYVETVKTVNLVNRNGQASLPNGWTYFGPAPEVYDLEPSMGLAQGGTPVTITGDNFTLSGGQLTVVFGSTQAGSVVRLSDTQLTCIAPPGPPGESVVVSVANVNGSGDCPEEFYYIPPPVTSTIEPDEGYLTGGTDCVITGSGFEEGDTGTLGVFFGTIPAASFTILDDNTISCTTPPGPYGEVDVNIVNENGTGALQNGFNYTSPIYWDTNKTQSYSLYDEGTSTVSANGNTIPMYGGTYSSATICDNGHVNMASTYTAYYNIPYVLTDSPMINMWQVDTYCGNTGVYSHVATDRLIFTYDTVPEYYSSGALKIQVHLLFNGVIGIVYNGQNTSNMFYGPVCGISPALSSFPSGVDLSSDQTCTSTTALIESFSGPASFDLDNGHLLFVPLPAGGYASTFIDVVPTAP